MKSLDWAIVGDIVAINVLFKDHKVTVCSTCTVLSNPRTLQWNPVGKIVGASEIGFSVKLALNSKLNTFQHLSKRKSNKNALHFVNDQTVGLDIGVPLVRKLMEWTLGS